MAFCNQCGKPTTPSDRFCMSCGATIPSAPPQQTGAIPVPPAPKFCQACGKQAAPNDSFCMGCGAPLHIYAAATAPPAAPVPTPNVTPPPAPQWTPVPSVAAPPPKSHSGIWIVLGLAIVAAIAIGIYFLSQPRPEDSLDQARTAYLQHDQANFDKYVDVNSVLSDGVDQGVNSWLKDQNAGTFETAATQLLTQTVKGAYLPGISKSVDQLIVSGNLPDDPQSGSSDAATAFVTGFISKVLRAVVSSQLSYQGVASKNVSGSDAYLDLNIRASGDLTPITIRVRMQKVDDHWRVVAIQDLAALLQQISQRSHP